MWLITQLEACAGLDNPTRGEDTQRISRQGGETEGRWGV